MQMKMNYKRSANMYHIYHYLYLIIICFHIIAPYQTSYATPKRRVGVKVRLSYHELLRLCNRMIDSVLMAMKINQLHYRTNLEFLYFVIYTMCIKLNKTQIRMMHLIQISIPMNKVF